MPLIGSGPIWKEVIDPKVTNCRNNWWLNLFLIQNLYKSDQMVENNFWFHFENKWKFLFITVHIVCSSHLVHSSRLPISFDGSSSDISLSLQFQVWLLFKHNYYYDISNYVLNIDIHIWFAAGDHQYRPIVSQIYNNTNTIFRNQFLELLNNYKKIYLKLVSILRKYLPHLYITRTLFRTRRTFFVVQFLDI